MVAKFESLNSHFEKEGQWVTPEWKSFGRLSRKWGPGSSTSGCDAVLYGDLAVIMGGYARDARPDLKGSRPTGEIPPMSQLSVVAGARFELTTFRL